jgi:hypothetical protein
MGSSIPPPSPSSRVGRQVEAYAGLIGTWEAEGDVTGTTSYAWLPGGYFIFERVALLQRGHPLQGVALIGQTRAWRGGPSPDITSRFYDSEGNSIDYVYELAGDSLTIWLEERGSDAVFEAEFEDNWTVLRGAWSYPSGARVESLARKISADPDYKEL